MVCKIVLCEVGLNKLWLLDESIESTPGLDIAEKFLITDWKISLSCALNLKKS